MSFPSLWFFLSFLFAFLFLSLFVVCFDWRTKTSKRVCLFWLGIQAHLNNSIRYALISLFLRSSFQWILHFIWGPQFTDEFKLLFFKWNIKILSNELHCFFMRFKCIDFFPGIRLFSLELISKYCHKNQQVTQLNWSHEINAHRVFRRKKNNTKKSMS